MTNAIAGDRSGNCPRCGHELPDHIAQARPRGAVRQTSKKVVVVECKAEACACTFRLVFSPDDARFSAVF